MPTQDYNLSVLRNLLGPQGLREDHDACRQAGRDWRGRYSGPVLAIARPKDTAQAAAVVNWAQQTQTPLVPQGGNSSLSGGAVPSHDAPPTLILSSARLNKIRHLDRDQRLVIAESGLILEALQAHVAPLEVPIDLGGRGSAQMGGLLACHAGGLNVVRYGGLRAHVRGLEAVLPNGEIYHGLNTVKKDNTGYDLKSLLIGSEGTLGFITAFCLQLYAPPADRLTALVACDSPAAALDLFLRIEPLFPAQVYASELMPAIGVQRALDQNQTLKNPFAGPLPHFIFLLELGLRAGLEDAERNLALETLTQHKTGPILLAQTGAQRNQFWHLRESLVTAQTAYGPSLKHDVCVPLPAIPALLDKGQEIAQHHMRGCVPLVFGHLGDGSFHFNISHAPNLSNTDQREKSEALTRALHDLVHKLGGSISAEHGVGQARRAEVGRLRDPAATRAMHAIKSALDPYGLFNPGKVL